jgi:hypothetical protein
MIELLFIPFAIIFVVVQLSDRKAIRVIFSGLTLLALAACGTMLRLAHNYGNRDIAVAVERLTNFAQEDKREQLKAASKQFRRERQSESPFDFSISAASRLRRAVQQADLPLPKQDGEQAAPSDGDKLPN